MPVLLNTMSVHVCRVCCPVALLISTLNAGCLESAGIPAFPLPVLHERSADARREAKPVLESRSLDAMEDASVWIALGPAHLALTDEQPTQGHHALRLTSPTKLDRPGPVPGRPFAEAVARRSFSGEDWTAFNRISFRVHPHLPGFRNISLLVKFHAAGSDRWSYTFGHLHHVLLKPGQWNHVVWEIPHLPRTNVTAIDFVYRLQGNEPCGTNTVRFDFDDLRLERVANPDPFHGWAVAPGVIAYSHLGYRPTAAKIAVAAPGPAAFELIHAGVPDTLPAYRGRAHVFTHALGAFAELDFSAHRQDGTYILRYGDLATTPFTIGENTWEPAWIATLNQYACQRCGEAVPGIHDACHRDAQVAHGDLRISLDGGWHDAGDLSQGLANTSEAVTALFQAAEGRRMAFPDLADRLAREARWGIDWIHRTRFQDGRRAVWVTLDFWTDNILGTPDDVLVQAGHSSLDTLLAIQAGARAARSLARVDPIVSAYALRIALEDWHRELGRFGTPRTELVAAAINAAIELYRATGNAEHRDRAAEFARHLLDAQQTTPPEGWSVPLAGYFHTDPEKRRLLRYNHRSHEDGPAVALAGLIRTFPQHRDAPRWREALLLQTEFLLATAKLNAPWNIPAAGIYATTEGDEASREQARQGVRLDDTHFLRRFPVWGDVRGNSGVLLSQARALSAAALALDDPRAAQLAGFILEWHLGRNPFGQSLLYGVGHHFTAQYTATSGDITGGLPVGIQTRHHEDVPYWPASNCYNFAEIWIHSSSRFLAVLTDLADR